MVAHQSSWTFVVIIIVMTYLNYRTRVHFSLLDLLRRYYSHVFTHVLKCLLLLRYALTNILNGIEVCLSLLNVWLGRSNEEASVRMKRRVSEMKRRA